MEHEHLNEQPNTTQMRKGILEYCILLIMAEQEIYASSLIDELKKVGLIVAEGTIYPLLTRLKNAGYFTYVWREAGQGPPRKYYSISETGLKQLAGLDQAWLQTQDVVETLRSKYQSSSNSNTTNIS